MDDMASVSLSCEDEIFCDENLQPLEEKNNDSSEDGRHNLHQFLCCTIIINYIGSSELKYMWKPSFAIVLTFRQNVVLKMPHIQYLVYAAAVT